MKNALIYAVNDKKCFVDGMINSINSFAHTNSQLLDNSAVVIITDKKLDLSKIDRRINYTTINSTYDYSQFQSNGFTKYTYFRWEMFHNPFFQEFDNMLYLDCDTEFESSIDELFNEEMPSGIYVVKELNTDENDKRTSLVKQIGDYPVKDIYFNAGVMFITSKLLGNELLCELFNELVDAARTHAFWFADQCASNFVLLNKKYKDVLKFLDTSYNDCWATTHFSPEYWPEKTKIRHYSGPSRTKSYNMKYI